MKWPRNDLAPFPFRPCDANEPMRRVFLRIDNRNRSLGPSRLERSHESYCDRRPGRVGDDGLASTGAGGKEVKPIPFTPDQASEQEAARGAREEEVAVHCPAELVGVEAFAPNLITGAIIARARRNGDRHQPRPHPGRNDDGGAARRNGAIYAKHGDDRKFATLGVIDKVRCLDIQSGGDAVKPSDRYGSRSHFQSADGLRRGGWLTGPRHIVERHASCTADFADAGNHFMALSRTDVVFRCPTHLPMWQVVCPQEKIA